MEHLDKTMSKLIAIGFKDEFTAQQVLLDLRKLQKRHLIDLEDAAVAVKNSQGKVKLHQTNDLVTAGAVSGSFWGLLIGTLFLTPLFGALVGAASGAAVGALTDIGINDDFMRELAGKLEPGTSALFILVRQATPDKVLKELCDYEAHIITTSLSYDAERKLREAWKKIQEDGPLAFQNT